MASNLTGSQIKDTYNQLLHVDGGVQATAAIVYSGTGVASAMKLGTGDAQVDNIKFDGNTISTTDTNGNLTLSPNGSGAVVITNAAITGGAVSGITDLAVADGGTGASTASAARTNLGLGTMATQDANAIAVTGGTFTGVTITGSYSGITSLSAATMSATSIMGYVAGAGGTVTQATNKSTGVTLNKATGQITMNNASLGANTAVTFTLTNSAISSTSIIQTSISSAATANNETPRTCHAFEDVEMTMLLSPCVNTTFSLPKGERGNTSLKYAMLSMSWSRIR